MYLGPSGTPITSVAEVGGRYFAGTTDGLLRYDAHRAQWMPAGFAGKAVFSITTLPSGSVWVTVRPHGADTTSAVAYLSEDAGATWQARDGGLSAQVGYHGLAVSFAFDPGDQSRLYMGLSAQVVRSLDGGASWTYTYGGPTDAGLGIAAIAPSATGSARVWAGGQDGMQLALVIRSDDRGSSWTLLRPDLAPGDGVLAIVTDPRNDARAFLGMAGAVWVTDDSGASWRTAVSTVHPGWVTGLAYQGSSIVAIADEVVLSTSGTPQSICGVYTSPDGGVTWDTLSVPATATGARGLHVTAGRALVFGTESGVWTVATK